MSKKSGKSPLPRLMVAPNGARRLKSDHPAIPLTDDELVATALSCEAAGADGIHIHIRSGQGQHLLDVGRYRALLQQLSEAVPSLYLQVTSEAAERYVASAQQTMVKALEPDHVSVALREMVRTEEDWAAASEFYDWAEDAGTDVQHIVYSPEELRWFLESCDAGRIPGDHHLLQLVLGTYDGSKISRPQDIKLFTALMDEADISLDWGLCAFGREETECLVEAARLGGKGRVGFENSLWHSDGSIAPDNAARVREVASGIAALSVNSLETT
ncbi:3-keto-5-aminohexanoate cleavage protein [Planktotalea sp.]|uniref:3-keto-5-aminohexanoate cleavage protein n=1 Tax=Planktotalea sp. TaxID=2029877 RepID=UPI0032971249